jgi:hypothetical protein
VSAVWTRLRRLVASIMLVAVASFVLHGGAMAGLHQHGPGSADCGTPAPAGHVHQAGIHDHGPSDIRHAPHDHGSGTAHQPTGADVASDDVPHDRQAAGEGSACCAGVCAAAVIAVGLETASTRMGSRLVVIPGGQRGSGIDPNGLKRPPRTLSIA